MSTKALEEALDELSRRANLRERDSELAALCGRARLELEAIRTAAKDQQERWPEDINSDFWVLMDAIAKDAP